MSLTKMMMTPGDYTMTKSNIGLIKTIIVKSYLKILTTTTILAAVTFAVTGAILSVVPVRNRIYLLLTAWLFGQIIIVDHLYSRIYDAFVCYGRVKLFDFPTSFLPKAIIFGLMQFILFLASFLLFLKTQLIQKEIYIAFVLFFWYFTSIAYASFAVKGSSLGGGIADILFFTKDHPVLSMITYSLFAGLILINNILSGPALILLEFIRSYALYLDYIDIGHINLRNRGVYYERI